MLGQRLRCWPIIETALFSEIITSHWSINQQIAESIRLKLCTNKSIVNFRVGLIYFLCLSIPNKATTPDVWSVLHNSQPCCHKIVCFYLSSFKPGIANAISSFKRREIFIFFFNIDNFQYRLFEQSIYREIITTKTLIYFWNMNHGDQTFLSIWNRRKWLSWA